VFAGLCQLRPQSPLCVGNENGEKWGESARHRLDMRISGKSQPTLLIGDAGEEIRWGSVCDGFATKI